MKENVENKVTIISSDQIEISADDFVSMIENKNYVSIKNVGEPKNTGMDLPDPGIELGSHSLQADSTN